MATLDTQQVQYELALANLLDAYGGSESTGTILETRVTIINMVKAKLDELIPEGEGLQFSVEGDINISDPLNLLINAILDEAAKHVLLTAPIHILDPVKSDTETGTANDADDKIGYIPLPTNFLRFASLKMTDWQHGINDVLRPQIDMEEYAMQQNPFVRGGVAHPKAAYSHRTISTGDTIEQQSLVILGDITYGALYNHHCITGTSPITATNAHVPTAEEWGALIIAVGGQDIAGAKLKEVGTDNWEASEDSVGTDDYGFGVKPGGTRWTSGPFLGMGDSAFYFTATMFDGTHAQAVRFDDNKDSIYAPIPQLNITGNVAKKSVGYSLRLIVDTPIEVDGDSAIYVGNDDRRYDCKLMPDGEWWTVNNLCETQYQDNTEIVIVSDDTEWEALEDNAGMCYYDNDPELAREKTVVDTVDVVVASGEVTNKRVIEYFSIDGSHNIDWLYYIQETLAEDLQDNLQDALTWQSAGMILQITERVDLAKIAFEQEQLSYQNM